ncbi:MFS transporter [Uliginosibacterium sp. 31-16]|uniref:MFS transporter n=1 Tax=Uliginosibacterium sp. 31-16 TaxID=3068315 RepID=UPI00274022D8|nr:MFS transporter [Uliginosibacterium sp. 31-16]MDP5240700.1 MFS transporter [Uliginosibacterium sp. 31-16]
MNENDKNFPAWLLLALAAAAMLATTMGARQSLGLFLSPLNTATGLGVASISLAMAVGQFVWGAVQPVAGAVADRYGPGRVLVAGLFILSAGLALTPFMHSTFGLSLTLGLLMAAGSGAGSFSVLIGAVALRIPANHRGMASGIINAGGSFGQFVFAPVVQGLILLAGWMGALWALAAITLCALPLVRVLKKPVSIASSVTHAAETGAERLSCVLRRALQDRSYLLLHAGFFTCGFHIAFLVTHLPGEVSLCGLPAGVASWTLGIIGLSNIFGSIAAGWAVQRYRSKMVLFWMYGSRAVLILVYLAAPKTELTFYLFAAGLGFTWLATVPPTAGVVSKLFGNRHLGTLFGLTLLSHQTGGFLGAWLGGLALARWGCFTPMWWADIVLAALAAVLNLPIREAKVLRNTAPHTV